jgi:hypothetical protein
MRVSEVGSPAKHSAGQSLLYSLNGELTVVASLQELSKTVVIADLGNDCQRLAHFVGLTRLVFHLEGVVVTYKYSVVL